MRWFLVTLDKKWQNSKRTVECFMSKEEKWLQLECTPVPSNLQFKKRSIGGRPEISFDDSSNKSQERIILKLSRIDPPKKLIRAFIKTIKRDTFHLSPVTKQLINQTSFSEDLNVSLSPLEALRLFFKANLKVSQYKILHQSKKDIFPRYDLLLEKKRMLSSKSPSFRR